MRISTFILSLIILFGIKGYGQNLSIYWDDNDLIGFKDFDTDEIIVPAKYDLADSEKEGMIRVAKEIDGENVYGFVNAKTGEEVIPLIYEDTDEFASGLVSVWKKGSNQLFVDTKGNETLGHLYDKYLNVDKQFGDGLLVVCDYEGGFGFINKNDEVIIPLKYEDAVRFSEGLAPVKMNNLYGFINTSDELVIPFKYTKAWKFCEGLSMIEMGDKMGYINLSGEEVIPLIYEEASNFEGGYASVKKDGEYFNIDKEGNITD